MTSLFVFFTARREGDANSDEAAYPPCDPDEGCVTGLSKVVMARRSSVGLQGPVCGLWLLEALQVSENNFSRVEVLKSDTQKSTHTHFL